MSLTWMWWVIWFPLAIGSFGLIEGYALKHPDRQWTLSRTIATVGARWPLSIGLWGGFFVGLLVHFFWHFCPDGVSVGMTPQDFLECLKTGCAVYSQM